MKKALYVVGLAATSVASAAFAHGDISCNVPKAEWKKHSELQSKLESEGWKVRKVKTENGCYEVYGLDDKGRRAEAFFDPKTFEKVGEAKRKD